MKPCHVILHVLIILLAKKQSRIHFISHLSPTACSTKEVLPGNIPTFTIVTESLRLSDESHFSFSKTISVSLPDYTDKSSLNHLKAELSNCDENLQSPSSFLD